MVFILALFGMICWGIAPIFGKLGLSKVDPLTGLAFRTYFSGLLLTGFICKSGVFSQIKEMPPKSMFFLAIEGILATLVGDWAYYAALKYGEVSFVTLVMSCSPVISIIGSIILFNEQITLTRLLGTFLIIIGLMLVVK